MDVPSYKEGESVGFFLAGQHALLLRCGMHGWSSRGHANRRCLLAYRVPAIRRYFATARAPRRGVAQHVASRSRCGPAKSTRKWFSRIVDRRCPTAARATRRLHCISRLS
jgi:hypothetical protein